MEKGILITFEGNDGAGKSTALETITKALQSEGYPVLSTREPGGCVLGEKIRDLLLDPANAMDPKTEALLYAASRREHLVKTIKTALEAGQIVLCDRFLDSSLAYQGAGRGLGLEEVEKLNDFGLEGFRPDLTLFFSLDQETEQQRVQQRGDMNRLDLESEAFHTRVRQGFETLQKKDPERIQIVDGSKDKKTVFTEAMQIIKRALDEAGYA